MPGIFSRIAAAARAFRSPSAPSPGTAGDAAARTTQAHPSLPQGWGYSNPLRQWAGQVVEKVRVASVGGRLRFLPWYDPYTDESPEMRQEYRKMVRDDAVKAAFLEKIVAVISQDLQVHPVEPESERHREAADFVRYAYQHVKGRTRAVGWSILHPAVIDGHSVCEKVWEPEPLRRGRFATKWVWHAVKAKDTHFLQLGIDPYRNVTAIRGQGFNAGRVWMPDDFVVFSYMALFESPAGTSDFRAAYRPYWIKDTVWKLRSLHLDKFTGPFLKGEYTTQDQKAALETAFEDARATTWLTVPAGSLVDALDLSMRGTTDFEACIKDCDRAILVAIAGAYLQILEGQTPGGRGDTQVHKETSELIQWMLSAALADAYREQMVVELVERNYHDVEPPDISIGSISDAALLESLKLDEGLQQLGLRLSRKERQHYYGRQEPEDDGDLLQPPQPPQPPGGGPPGGGLGGPQPPPAAGGGPGFAEFAESYYAEFAAASAQRKVGEVWEGNVKGRFYTKRQDGRVVPAPNPNKQQGIADKKTAATDKKAVAAKAKQDTVDAKAKAKQDAAAHVAQVKANASAAAKDAAAGKTLSPEQLGHLGQAVLTLNLKDLQALKKELKAAGNAGTKAGAVKAIKDKALAAVQAKPEGQFTPEFKEWFDGSKVVGPDGAPKETHPMDVIPDAQGKPIVVYHGGKDFEHFDKSKIAHNGHWGAGFYFTENGQEAQDYLNQLHKGGDKGKIHEVYLQIKKPFDTRKDRVPLSSLPEAVASKMVGGKPSAEDLNYRASYDELRQVMKTDDINNHLQQLGYDGIATKGAKGNWWVAFEPEQIKHTNEAQKPAIKVGNKPVAQQPQAWNAVVDSWHEMEKEFKLNSVLPSVPKMVDLMKAKMPGITTEQVHGLLQQAQKEGRLVLQVANNPHLEPRGKEFIPSNRGPLGYLSVKDASKLPETSAPAPTAPAKPAPALNPAAHHAVATDVVSSLAGKSGVADMVHVRKALAAKGLTDRAQQDAVLNDLRKRGVLTAAPYEGRFGLSKEQQAAQLPEPGKRAGEPDMGLLSLKGR